MKKFLLFVAAAIIAVSASAQGRMGMAQNDKTKSMPAVKTEMTKTLPAMTAKSSKVKKAPKKEATEERTVVTIPETAVKTHYSSSYYYYYYYYWFAMSGMSLNVYVDGNDMYLENLFNSAYYMPIKGEKKEDGTIVIKKQKVYEGIDYYGDGSEYDDLYFTLIETDDDGNASFPDDDIVLYPTEDGSYTMCQSEDETVMYGLCDQYGYYWSLDANLSIAPFTSETEPVTLPEGAEPQAATYKSSYNSYGTVYTNCVLESMYVDGAEVYLGGLCPDSYGWVKGTVKDGKLVVPTNQFLGYDDTYLLTFKAGKNYTYKFEWIDKENYEYETTETYEDADELTFTNVDGKWVLDDGLCVLEVMADGNVGGVYFGNEVKAYEGDAPAVPADPSDLTITDYSEYGMCYFAGNTKNLDANGEYINLEKMELSLWVDGDMLTLSPDDGYVMDEDVTWMPYGWYGDEGYLDFTSSSPFFYLYISLYEQLGMQVRYTVDGVTKYSNIVYCDLEGEETTYEADHETGEPTGESWKTGIETVSANTSANVNAGTYNLLGQRVNGNAKGLLITAGKKVLK